MKTSAHVFLVLFFPALALTSFFRARALADDRADQMLAAMALYDRQIAQVEAAGFCRELRCRQAVTVSVEPDDRMAETIVAHTTRGEDGTGCVVHVKKRWVVLDAVIAHEVCHCAQDYGVLGVYGYLPTVSKEERRWREKEARACGERLTRRP